MRIAQITPGAGNNFYCENGRQKKELQRLIDWLVVPANRPDVVCLSNVLLAGLAGSIKAELGVPVVCLLQDEDEFVDAMGPQYAERIWQIIRDCCMNVDIFISVSRYYETVCRQRLGFPADKIRVVYTGILPDGYDIPSQRPEIPTIGYLSRMCFNKGLDTLVDAFNLVKKKHRLRNLKLRVAGGKTGNDELFIKRIRQQLTSSGLIDDVEFLADFGLYQKQARVAFLQSLSVLSIPEKRPVAYGLYVLEALATGVPVVQPASGVFPELLEITGGGLLFEPNNVKALAAAIESLLVDSQYAHRLAEQGRKNVFEKFNIKQTAQDLLRIYHQVA